MHLVRCWYVPVFCTLPFSFLCGTDILLLCNVFGWRYCLLLISFLPAQLVKAILSCECGWLGQLASRCSLTWRDPAAVHSLGILHWYPFCIGLLVYYYCKFFCCVRRQMFFTFYFRVLNVALFSQRSFRPPLYFASGCPVECCVTSAGTSVVRCTVQGNRVSTLLVVHIDIVRSFVSLSPVSRLQSINIDLCPGPDFSTDWTSSVVWRTI